MDVLGSVFYLLLNAFRIYVIYRFFGIFLNSSHRKNRDICLYSGYFLATSLTYFFFHYDFLNLVINAAGLILAAFICYGGNIRRKFLAAVLNMGVGVIAENLAWVIFVKDKAVPLETYGLFFSVFLFFIIEVFIEKTAELKSGIEISGFKNLLLLFISAGSMFIANVLIENSYGSMVYPVISLCLLLEINISIFYLYEKLSDHYKELKDKEMVELQLKMYQRQMEIMKNANDTYKTVRHDIKHHTRMIADYIKKGENVRALEYMDRMNEYVGNAGRYVETGNEGIDGVLNYMIEEVYKIGGIVTTDLKIAEGIRIDDFDINMILSNLLMNAYEAMQKCVKKELLVTMNDDRGILSIGIRNTYNGIYIEKGGELLSTKEGLGHGMGLLSVRKAVEKYHGQMMISHTEDKFDINIFLYLFL